MDTELTLKIVTIVVAILSIFINVLFSVIMARKNKYIDITVKQRIENLRISRELTEKLMYMSSAEYIANSDTKELSCHFVEVRDRLSYYYMRPYSEEREIVSHIKSLSDEWFCYINNQTPDNLKSLNKQREALFALTKVNETAYWRFVSDHYKLSVHSGKQFTYFYTKTRREFIDGGFGISKFEEEH